MVRVTTGAGGQSMTDEEETDPSTSADDSGGNGGNGSGTTSGDRAPMPSADTRAKQINRAARQLERSAEGRGTATNVNTLIQRGRTETAVDIAEDRSSPTILTQSSVDALEGESSSTDPGPQMAPSGPVNEGLSGGGGGGGGGEETQGPLPDYATGGGGGGSGGGGLSLGLIAVIGLGAVLLLSGGDNGGG